MTGQAVAAPGVGQALTTMLRLRPELGNVRISDSVPVTTEEVRTVLGAFEAIWVSGATGTFNSVVMRAGSLAFDETVSLTVNGQVLGRTSDDDQRSVTTRAGELLYEVLAEVAGQESWDQAALGLNVFDYVWFTPTNYTLDPGRLEGQAKAYAAGWSIDIQVRSRKFCG